MQVKFQTRKTAVEFLRYTGRESGNKLEKDVSIKLQDHNELAALKADALMFFHVRICRP